MRQFKDNAGRTWNVSVDIDGIRRVRSALNVNLVSSKFKEVLEQLLGDPVLLCDVLYVLCQPEAEKKRCNDVAFGSAMSGDAIDLGTKALLEEIANFTPNPRDRARVQKVLQTLYQLAEISRDNLEEAVETQTESLLKKAETETYGQASGASPAPSASIPDP